MRRVRSLCLLVSPLLAPFTAAAQDAGAAGAPPLVLDPVVVTARGRALPLSDMPGSAAVMTAEDLDARSGAGVSDLLAFAPGIETASDGPWGSDINIRGLSRDSIVQLIDGCRVNTATDIGARFGLVNPHDVERVEALKGPVSALYGSGSLGGVVNIVTRGGDFSSAPRLRGDLRAGTGSNPRGYDLYGSIEAAAPDRYAWVSQGWRDRDSYEDGGGREVHNTQYRDRQTDVKFGRRLARNWSGHVNLQYAEAEEVGVPGSGTAPLPAAADVTYPRASRALLSAALAAKPAGGVVEESRATLYYQRIDRRARIDGFPAGDPLLTIDPAGDHETYGAKWLVDVRAGQAHRLATGVDAWQRRLDSRRTRTFKSGRIVREKPLPDARASSAGVFAEDEWAVIDALRISGGARLDGIFTENDAADRWPSGEETDAAWNAHLGAAWRVADGVSLKGVVASGYRAASIEERFQYLQLGGGRVRLGDPDLDPERSVFAEAGVDVTGSAARLSVSAFRNELRDLIGEDLRDPATVVNANIDEARIQGVEAELRWFARPGLEVYANAAAARGRDTRNDENLAGIAPLNGAIGMAGSAGHFHGRAETRLAAAQRDVPAGGQEADGWARVDLRGSYTLPDGDRRHRVYAGVDNLFDETYRNYLSTYRGETFNEPGRAFVAGYELLF